MVRRAIPALVFVSLLASASDLKYSRKTKDATGEHEAITFYYQGQRIRIDHRNEVGFNWKDGKPETVAYGPRMATIYQCDMHRILQLDFEHHQYTVTQLDGSATSPDEQGAAVKTSGAKVKVTVESRDTGETKQAFGMTARHYVVTRRMIPGPGSCSKPSTINEDGWFVDIPQPKVQGCGPVPTPPAGATASYVELRDGSCGWDEPEVERVGPQPPPFAVDLNFTRHEDGSAASSSTTTLTDLSRLPLDPQIFDLPTGYKHVDKLDDSPNLPWLLRGKLMWQSVKTTVWGWTPWGK